jgi:hypothetical protein
MWKARTFTVLRCFPSRLDEVWYVLSGDACHDSCPSDRVSNAGVWVVGVGSATADLSDLFLNQLKFKVNDT